MTIFPMTLIRSGGLPLDTWTPLATGVADWDALQSAEQAAAGQVLQAFDAAVAALPDSPLRTSVYNARKGFFQRRKLPLSGFNANGHAGGEIKQIHDSLLRWHETQQKIRSAELVFEEGLAAGYRYLQAVAQDVTMHRALLFASHDLLAGLRRFAEKPASDLDKKDRRTAFSLLQYLTRAVFKTSPLGRFTTVQVRPLSAIMPERAWDRPPLVKENWFESKSLVTPNVALLPAVYEVLLRESAFFESLSLSLNPCVAASRTPGKGQMSWLYFDGEREAFQEMAPDPVADFVVGLFLANHRKMPFPQLIEHLENEAEANKPQLYSLVNQLVGMGLLEWQLPEPGLSANWCAKLFNQLGHFPPSAVLTEAAYLLQWMRTAARALPFQTVEDGQQLQQAALREAKGFLEKHGAEMPPIPPEQLFFEDLAQEVGQDLPAGVMEVLIGQLQACWQQKESHPLTPIRARLFEFAGKYLSDGKSVDFLEFSKRFLANRPPASAPLPGKPSHPRYRGKIGALLQVFRENGEFKAVVNALYPGGGKLFARWLPLFPEGVSDLLKIWANAPPATLAPFPAQGWSNANFQPAISDVSVAVPDGRLKPVAGGREILLGELAVQKNEHGFPEIVEKQSGQKIVFNDLGLEAPETRSPVMQVLWHLGVPWVSSELLLPEVFEGTALREGVRYRPRLEFQSLALARAAWEIPQALCGKLFQNGRSQAERVGRGVAALKAMGVPKRFFGRATVAREKPQFFDMDSPVSMLLLEKMLHRLPGNLFLTEMLPTPEHWLGNRVGEFVVEFEAG